MTWVPRSSRVGGFGYGAGVLLLTARRVKSRCEVPASGKERPGLDGEVDDRAQRVPRHVLEAPWRVVQERLRVRAQKAVGEAQVDHIVVNAIPVRADLEGDGPDEVEVEIRRVHGLVGDRLAEENLDGLDRPVAVQIHRLRGDESRRVRVVEHRVRAATE